MMNVVTRGLPAKPIGVQPLSFADLTDDLQTRLNERVERLGYLGAFFAYTGYQPSALSGFIDFTEALKASLPFGRAELVALTVARLMGNDYELEQHVRLCAARGIPRDWIDELTTGRPTVGAPSALDASETTIVRFIEATVQHYGRRDRQGFADIVLQEGASTAIGLLLLVARYIAHATVSNVLALQPPFLDNSSEKV